MPPGEYLQYGGQAIVEGVMMRSPTHFSVACRAPSGEIVLQTEPIEKTWIGRQKWLKLPFLRGSLAILDSMALGTKAMKFAAKVQIQEEAPKGDEKAIARSSRVQDTAIGVTLVVSIAFGLLLFSYFPNLLAEQLGRWGVNDYRYKNLATECIKFVVFFGYIYGISRLKEIQRVFQYHGAEHKAINTFEAGQELTIENCRAQTRLHPRCGTSFAVVVLLVSMVIFTFVPRYPFAALKSVMLAAVAVRFLLEIVVLPIVAGASYEAIRLAGKFRNASTIRLLFWPGLMTQYITTSEPDESQIEVSLSALKAVVEARTQPSSEPAAATA